MRCKKCGREVKKDWKYCPYCGEKLKFRINFPKFFSEKSVEKEMEEILEAFGFPNIKIMFKTYEEPSKKIAQKQVRKELKRDVNQIVEPKTNIKHIAGKILIEIFLPDVNSINDVSVRRLEESIEIRAYSGKKMYFKVIPISKDYEIIKEEFRNKMLKITLNK
ncbi:MAG: zinc ribbon domain-containing protein [Nanoarchaeota archaeon]|nr:zinc ribbon domain-containing protein [Nanoarchaeota archaeon]